MYTKICSKCNEDVLLENYTKDSRLKSKIASACKDCKMKKFNSWKEENSDHLKEYRLKRKYNLTLNEYENMIVNGCHLCEACKNLHIDHDHETLKIRGILCKSCNQSLGFAQDDVGKIKNVKDYLIRTSDPNFGLLKTLPESSTISI